MYLWKINMIDGKSYIIKSEISDVTSFLENLFNEADVTTYPLSGYLSNEQFIATDVAIVSKTVASIAYQSKQID